MKDINPDYERKVKHLAAFLLKEAKDVFCNHGCNDLPDDTFYTWTKEEKAQFLKHVDEWNRGPLELESTDQLQDDICMGVCAHILVKSTFEK